MRARNIKPSIFKNEILGTADPLLTILFEGLWCEADRDGRLEDRPLRLKAEILPYRNDADVDTMLNWLSLNGFIARYEAQNTKVIQVLKFSDHQRPHNNEVASVLPSMDAIKHNQGKKPAQPRKKALRSDSLLSDSGSLIPDTTMREPRAFDPNSISGLNLEAWSQWVEYRAERKPAIKPASMQAAAEELAAFGIDQLAVVKKSIAAGYQGLFSTPKLNGKHLAPAPNHEAAWAEARSRAKAIGFRDPHPQESPGAYMTDIKMAESSPRSGPHSIAALAQKMRMPA